MYSAIPMQHRTIKVSDADGTRTCLFHVSGFELVGITISATYGDDEAAVLAQCIGVAIDPDVLRAAARLSGRSRADEALRALADNLSAVASAQLRGCRTHEGQPRQLRVGSISFGTTPARAKLLDLDSCVLQQVACACTSRRSAAALAATCKALRAAIAPADGSLAMPMPIPEFEQFDESVPHEHRPDADESRLLTAPHLFGSPSVLAYDAQQQMLVKSARPGLAICAWSSSEHRLTTAPALLEFEVSVLPAVGAVQFGVAGMGSSFSTHHALQCVLDGTGGMHRGHTVTPPTLREPRIPARRVAYGGRVRVGDRIGLLYLPARTRGCLAHDCPRLLVTTNGNACGRPVLLRPFSGGFAAYAFFLRFDCVPGTSVRLLTRRAPLAVPPLLRPGPARLRSERASRDAALSLAPDEARILVRTIGPDAHYLGFNLQPETATVGELAVAVASRLGHEPEQIELSISIDRDLHQSLGLMKIEGPHGGSWPSLRWGARMALQDDAQTLAAAGIVLEHNGCHLAQLFVHMPHLIS